MRPFLFLAKNFIYSSWLNITCLFEFIQSTQVVFVCKCWVFCKVVNQKNYFRMLKKWKTGLLLTTEQLLASTEPLCRHC